MLPIICNNIEYKEKRILDVICDRYSVCFVFEYIPNRDFWRQIEDAMQVEKSSIADYVTTIVNKFGMKYAKNGDVYYFYQEKFKFSPFCSQEELGAYIKCLDRILKEIPLSRYYVHDGKLVSYDEKKLKELIDEIVKDKRPGVSFNTGDLSSVVVSKLEEIMRINILMSLNH